MNIPFTENDWNSSAFSHSTVTQQFSNRNGRCKHIERRDARTTTFCTVASNICVLSVRNLLRLTLLAPKISRCFQIFGKFALPWTKLIRIVTVLNFGAFVIYCWLLCAVLTVVVQLHCCTVVLVYCCTRVLLYWCSVVLVYCCIGVLLYCCSVVLLYWCSVVLLFWCSVVLLYWLLLYWCTCVWCSVASLRDPRTAQERGSKTFSIQHNKQHSII